MSAVFNIPFNFQPSSVSVQTGSYTISAGKYARVVVNLEGSATFTIGGTTALRGTQNSVLGSSGTKTGNNTWNGTSTAGGLFSGNGGSGSLSDAFSSATDQKSLIADLWLPAGTVINGTGTWRAVVTEYANIS